jgi:endonuclease YncB( thermonuclease family)
MSGTTETGPRTEPGWHPDYDAPPGHERYWDGTTWTDRRRTSQPRPAGTRRLRVVALGLLLAVVVAGLSFAVTRTGSEDSERRSTVQTTSGAPAADDGLAPDEVGEVLDGRTLVLGGGTEVRLVGIDVPSACTEGARSALDELVAGRAVTLTRRGTDQDAQGRLLRYVEIDGVDVGLRLVRRGLASATDESHARGQIYRRIEARTASAC